MTKPYGYAGICQDTVWALGRTEAGMRRDLASQDEPPNVEAIPCTRRAFDAVRAGDVQIGGPNMEHRGPRQGFNLFVVDGVLDCPRGPGRPAKDPSAPKLRNFGIGLSVDAHARVMALSPERRAEAVDAMREALERFLEP